MPRNLFTTYTQPAPCPLCRKLTTGVDGSELCRKCYDDAGRENEHFDGYHTEAKNPKCHMCCATAQ